MERSIEVIWKEGFLQSDALVAPKINDLYNQKSRHVVDRFKKLGKANLIGLFIGSFIALCISFLANIAVFGFLIFSILIYLVVVGKKQAKMLQTIDTGVSSYQYLKDFDTWLKASIAEYGKIYKYAYPLLFMLIFLGTAYANPFPGEHESIMDKIMSDSDTYFFYGVPVYWLLSLICIVGISAYFSDRIYKFDLGIIYGRVFNKIEELLTDMEELRR